MKPCFGYRNYVGVYQRYMTLKLQSFIDDTSCVKGRYVKSILSQWWTRVSMDVIGSQKKKNAQIEIFV